MENTLYEDLVQGLTEAIAYEKGDYKPKPQDAKRAAEDSAYCDELMRQYEIG